MQAFYLQLDYYFLAKEVMAEPTVEALIEEAFSTGAWTEQTDKQTGRKFYRNTKTRKAVWNLGKELLQQRQNAAVQQAASLKRKDDRYEKARKRAEEEAEVKSKVKTLEQQKTELETEIARLETPVETEREAIMDLKKQIGDAQFSLQAVEKEAETKRLERKAELERIAAKVSSLQSVQENERRHQDAIKQQHAQLLAESRELAMDLRKEQTTSETLRASVRGAERKLEEIKVEQARQKAEIERNEHLVTIAEEELSALAKKKADMEERVANNQQQIKDMRERMELAKGVSAEHHKSLDLLQQLTLKVEKKKKFLRDMAKTEEDTDDINQMTFTSGKLRKLINSAEADNVRLAQLLKVLNKETKRTIDIVNTYRKQLGQMENDSSGLIPDWPFQN